MFTRRFCVALHYCILRTLFIAQYHNIMLSVNCLKPFIYIRILCLHEKLSSSYKCSTDIKPQSQLIQWTERMNFIISAEVSFEAHQHAGLWSCWIWAWSHCYWSASIVSGQSGSMWPMYSLLGNDSIFFQQGTAWNFVCLMV